MVCQPLRTQAIPGAFEYICMHRGIYSYDVGIAASDSLTEVAGAKGKKREQELIAKAIPQWVIAAPRAAAKAYVARLNEMLGVASSHSHMSAAALLFDVSPVELEVSIPTSLAGFTISQVCLWARRPP